MEEQFNNALKIIKEQDINACIAGSCMLGYQEGWNQDIDVFCYDKPSFSKLLFFMFYNPMFTILDPLEKHKFEDYINNDKSSLESIGLITIKFKYNLTVDVNVVFKKFHHTIFDVLANFDLDVIAQGYDIKSKNTMSLRTTTGLEGNWNTWNPSFYKNDVWGTKRLLRQFERVVKYTERGYNLDSVTDKYLSIIDEILATENFYKTERGTRYYEDTIEQFTVVSKILQVWKKDKTLTPEQLSTLKTLI